MSGPKVVNIEALRRQQRRACEAKLRVLQQLLEENARFQKNVNGSAEMMSRIETLRKGEQFAQLLEEANSYVEFYRAENAQLRGNAVASRIEAHRKAHQTSQAAAHFREMLLVLPATAERSLLIAQLLDDSNLEALGQTIARAEAEVSLSRMEDQSNRLANQLKATASEFSDPNLRRNEGSRPEVERDADELRLERCWNLLSELELDGESIDSWRAKLHRATNANSSDRGLLVDSLALELSEVLKRIRSKKTIVSELSGLLQTLNDLPASVEKEEWHKKLTSALSRNVEYETALILSQTCKLWADQELRRADAAAQRAAFLEALSELGYEVREGMTTAWAEKGRVVVKKPSESTYGVELSAPATGQAVQVRVVASSSQGRSKQRDVEVEATWCGEFKQLRSKLEQSGFAIELKHAKAPGEVAIKSVEDGFSSTTSNLDARLSKREQTL